MELLVALIFGVVTGVLYGLAALGIVLVYRVSRVLNFALAGTASITSFEASSLLDSHVPWVAVLVIVLISGAALGAACYGVLSLARNADAIAIGVGTIGLLLLMQGAVGSIWGLNERTLPEPISGVFHLGSLDVSHFEVLAVVIALVAIGLAFLLVFRTRLGLKMRAVSSGPRTAELLGVDRRRTELTAWAIGGAAGSLAGLLIVPLLQLDQNVLIDFMLAAFAAVVLGGFTSLGGVVIAGVVVSVVLNVLATYVSSTFTDTFTFLIVAAVLFVRPTGLFGLRERSVAEPRLPTRRRIRAAARPSGSRSFSLPMLRLRGRELPSGSAALGLAVVVALVYGFAVGETTAYVFATALANFVAVLGVGTLAGQSGQVSLGQGAFVAIGAYCSGIVSVHLDASIWLALPIAVVVGFVIGLVVGWPAARLSGVYLVVFTLAFGLAVPEILTNWTSLTGGGNGLSIVLPDFLNNSRDQYLIALAVAAVAAIAYWWFSRRQAGRRWRAVRDSVDGVAGIGWSPTINKVSAFAFGSALAGLGGAMTGILTGYVSPDGFTVFLSIYLVIAVVIGGPGTILGSMIGALIITLLPYYLAGSSTPQLIFGIAVVAILILAPEGLVSRFASLSRSSVSAGGARAAASAPVPGSNGAAPLPVTARGALEPEHVPEDVLLTVEGLSVAYDGGLALDQVSLHVARGEAVAVVGPNGAGKSTLLRAVSGWVTPQQGHVRLGGADLAGRPAHSVAQLGLVHVPEGRGVFPGLTVAENLRLGYRPQSDRDEAELLAGVFEIFPKLQQRLDQDAGSMSGGEQQMLAVGRGLMSDPEVLMLDEPSLGLAPVVVEEMFEALTRIRARGLAVLLVEQNVRAAFDFADRALVLSGGECVMRGPTSELAAQGNLIEAFLV